jgi:hypothetical protein
MHTRAAGTALATIVNFILTFIIGQCFLSMLCSMRYGVFFFFAGEQAVGFWRLSHIIVGATDQQLQGSQGVQCAFACKQ